MAHSSVLSGIRVLDFGRYIAGPYCAALLADFGADVIRIDRVGGSEDRFVMPVSEEGEGAFFLQVNRNKRSITLDIDRAEGREVVRALVKTADVVVANMPPRTLASLGLDYPSLSAIKPDIILTASSAFGSHEEVAHRVGFDGVAQAMSGAVHLGGLPDQPAKAMVPVVDFSTALSCALGTVMALYERRASGRGQLVEGSLLHTALNLSSGALIEAATLGLDRQPTGNRSPVAGPSDLFRTQDGWVIVQVIGPALFKRWAGLVGRPDLLDEERFSDDIRRGENGAELSAIMAQWCASRGRNEVLSLLEQAKIPAGPVYSPNETLADETVKASRALHWTDYPGLQRAAPLVGAPLLLSRTPATIHTRPPRSGEHTQEVLEEAGYARSDIARLRSSGVI
ncbi:CoA transferase [Cupriavidus sp. 2SB]|uniref:CaiB/BaiF CoA transferase family protein n=1 Tax=Cupriavidus sp. 2SB TaxID=2502199 RepID=UPI0010F8A448|nr:CoA transferase [Cupriavidus sp. 2SB]